MPFKPKLRDVSLRVRVRGLMQPVAHLVDNLPAGSNDRKFGHGHPPLTDRPSIGLRRINITTPSRATGRFASAGVLDDLLRGTRMKLRPDQKHCRSVDVVCGEQGQLGERRVMSVGAR
jgi:hypothetical protein